MKTVEKRYDPLVFGKDGCPYTEAALEDFARRGIRATYIDVRKDPAELDRMLTFSGGKRRVPVIVEGGKVTIGFGGT
jgi:glutaredoxin 3